MKIRHDTEGKIESVGAEVDGAEFAGELPVDFLNTFALGKYKIQKNEDKTIAIIAIPGFVMPEKSVYTVDETENRNSLINPKSEIRNQKSKHGLRTNRK